MLLNVEKFSGILNNMQLLFSNIKLGFCFMLRVIVLEIRFKGTK